MKPLAALTERLARTDMLQLLALLFGLLLVIGTVAWPSGGARVNESWYSLAPARNALLALAAAGFGAAITGVAAEQHGPHSWRPGQAALTLAALLVWALLTLPIEVASYAATYPAVGLGWSQLVTALTIPAYFGLGLLLGRLTALLRAVWLLPLLVPAVMVGLGWLDLRLDRTLFNPWTAVLAPSPYALVAGAATLLTAATLVAPWLLPKRSAP